MIVKILPSISTGTVHVPSSKSYTHRAIICASFAVGVSRIENVQYSEDIIATIEAMKLCGVDIIQEETSLIITGRKKFSLSAKQIDCNESGSTLRFLIPLFSLMGQRVSFIGKNRLLKRPMSVYQSLFDKQNILFQQTEEEIVIEGKISADHFVIDGSVSSQFISGLLFALPLLQKDSQIEVVEPFESKSYVDITIEILADFGIIIEKKSENLYYIKGNQEYISRNYVVEGDYSQFAFYAVLAAINHPLSIVGVSHRSLQGDQAILSALEQFGAEITCIENGYYISPRDKKGFQFDLANCPDIGPILSVLAACANTDTTLLNTRRLEMKESNRMVAMKSELHKIGITVMVGENEAKIMAGERKKSRVIFDGQRDHRIVMSLAILSTVLSEEVEIRGAEAIQKSYPSFFEDLRSLGIIVEEV